MSCPSEETIALYAGADLEPAIAAALECHLSECAACAALEREFQSDRDLLASEPPELADFRTLTHGYSSWRPFPCRARSKLSDCLIAAAATLAAIGAGLAWRELDREVPAPPPVVARLDSPPVQPAAVLPRPQPRRARMRVRRPDFPMPPNAFRVPTKDPDVVIVWFTETQGESNE